MSFSMIPRSTSLEKDDWAYEYGEIKTPEDWYKYYPDRCMSNQTIFSVMTKTTPPNETELGHKKYGTPQGARGFERCYNLLKLYPTWQSQMGEVSAKFPEWAGFAREWGKLTKLYEKHDVNGLEKLVDKLNAEANGIMKLNKPQTKGIIWMDTFDKNQFNKRG